MSKTPLSSRTKPDIPVEVKVSSRARRVALRLDSSRRVMNLVVPKRASLRKAYQFAREHESWIRQKLAGLPPRVRFADGEVIPVFGQKRRINVTYSPALRSTRIILNKRSIRVLTNKKNPAGEIASFLKKEARDALARLAVRKANRIGRKIQSVQVRDMRTRWGSCASNGRLSFSWRMIFAPPEVMDYVVAHEVAHLIHMNHSKRFWALCERLSADYEDGKQWLQENGDELLRYG